MPRPQHLIFAIRALPAFIIYRLSSKRPIVDKDIKRWRERRGIRPDGAGAFFSLMRISEFRSLVNYRIPALGYVSWLAGRVAPALHINTAVIGPGLYFEHGFSTIVHARSIGRNCWINHGVTVGFNGADKYPVIGDDVTILAGAIVLGEISIGDNAVIGAGAVVTKSVPPNCVVVGSPAYIVRRDGVSCREDL